MLEYSDIFFKKVEMFSAKHVNELPIPPQDWSSITEQRELVENNYTRQWQDERGVHYLQFFEGVEKTLGAVGTSSLISKFYYETKNYRLPEDGLLRLVYVYPEEPSLKVLMSQASTPNIAYPKRIISVGLQKTGVLANIKDLTESWAATLSKKWVATELQFRKIPNFVGYNPEFDDAVQNLLYAPVGVELARK